jgi:chromate transporter
VKKLPEILYVSTKLGLTSFGGPIAHLGYFHNEYVVKRQWLDEKSYTDLVALCQFLPGPTSSQVSYSIGVIRGGIPGGIAAWLGFTLPSAIFLFLFAYFLYDFDLVNSGMIHGLKLVAVAIVAQAIYSMGKKFASEKITATIALVSAITALMWQSSLSQLLIILVAGITGLYLFAKQEIPDYKENVILIDRTFAKICLFCFFSLLIILPILRNIYPGSLLAMIDSFYRTGSIVFGGGHVVLPLLEKEVVTSGLVNKEQFLAGYGIAQAVPGPLFTFASYLGTVINDWKGAIIATISIFFPSLLLLTGTLTFWNEIRKMKKVQAALVGINAAVVGILLAAFYNPVWTSSVIKLVDFCLALLLFVLCEFWKIPPVIIVILGAAGGILFY